MTLAPYKGGTRSFAPCYVSEAVPGQETAKSLYVYLPAESECIYYPKDKTFPLWRQDANPHQMRCVIAPAHPEDQCRRLFYNQVGCAPIIKSRAITLNMAISLSAPIRRKFAPAAMFLVCRHPPSLSVTAKAFTGLLWGIARHRKRCFQL